MSETRCIRQRHSAFQSLIANRPASANSTIAFARSVNSLRVQAAEQRPRACHLAILCVP